MAVLQLCKRQKSLIQERRKICPITITTKTNYWKMVSKCVMKEYPEASCMDFSSAGLGQYVVISKSVLFELEKMVAQHISLKQREIKELTMALDSLRFEEHRKGGKA